MNIQLIEKHENIYRLLIDGVRCDFIPLELFVNSIMPVKKCYCNSSLVWYVNRKRVSYWQIKKAIMKQAELLHIIVPCGTHLNVYNNSIEQ